MVVQALAVLLARTFRFLLGSSRWEIHVAQEVLEAGVTILQLHQPSGLLKNLSPPSSLPLEVVPLTFPIRPPR